MPFIEMTGGTLAKIVDTEELHTEDLRSAGVTDECIIRVNQQGDIELRRHDGWRVIGGLLGGFEERVKKETGLNWA